MGRKDKKEKKQKRKQKKSGLTSATADRFFLYENSVQEPEADVEFILQAFRERSRLVPSSIREDFCGTAITAIEWVKHDASHTAIGVDLDVPTLAVAQQRVDERLDDEQKRRLRLIEEDVRAVKVRYVDGILACNFSYFLFRTRDELRGYFKHASNGLKRGGLLILDAYGGSDSFTEMREPRECDGFTYIWDQDSYSPVTGHVTNYIHFKFPDGTKMKKAFVYEWRLWTLPEIQELLAEAGFQNIAVYWEGTDPKTDEGNGVWSVETTGEADKGWVAYLVAEK
ncbi:MAG: class I SAM-dependent methyltransferase [Planctomycetota bacterium]